MLHVPAWFWLAILVLIPWSFVGLLQKLSTNYISAESSMIWSVVGFLLMLPWLRPKVPLSSYSAHSLVWALLAGTVNAVGGWALFVAMKSGGRASVVTPLTALYPVLLVIISPFVLHEYITLRQGIGLACGFIAIALLSG